MVVAVGPMCEMEMAADEIVEMIPVRNSLVAAS
jgi:hypothetical protein